MCPPKFHELLYKLLATLCVVSDCAPPTIKKSFLCLWVTNNSTEVTNTLDKLRHARALDSFDFSTLYTNTPHCQLKTRMEELIRKAYNTRDASLMALGKDYAYWTSDL